MSGFLLNIFCAKGASVVAKSDLHEYSENDKK